MPEHTIAENLQRLIEAKEDIAVAIVAKGGTVAAGDGLEEFAADITTIPSGGGGLVLSTTKCKPSTTKFKSEKWVSKTWSGLTSFNGDVIWTDGNNIYYSSGSTQYVLDKSTSTWTAKTWSRLTSFNGNVIWTDGENIYYSYSTTQYVLDKSTSTWTAKTWSGLTDFRSGYIWTDGENVYYSNDASYYGTTGNYVLDKSTSTWTAKTWSGLISFNGANVWTDGENIYYSSGSSQYVLEKQVYNAPISTHTPSART